jgi:hypothetical protein
LGAGGVGWLFEDIQGLEDGDMISLDVLLIWCYIYMILDYTLL